MDIHAKPGTKVIFLGGVTQDQINWGSHENPRGFLMEGKEYTVLRTEVHSFHTKVFLTEWPDKPFNSVWFRDL